MIWCHLFRVCCNKTACHKIFIKLSKKIENLGFGRTSFGSSSMSDSEMSTHFTAGLIGASVSLLKNKKQNQPNQKTRLSGFQSFVLFPSDTTVDEPVACKLPQGTCREMFV